MEKLTELYIYALKDKGPTYVEQVTTHFMARHAQFRGMTLEQGVRHFWLDYLSTADKPHEDMARLFEHMDKSFDFNGLIERSDVTWAMMCALKRAKDRDENFKFINGFGEDYK
jgi:hypothetical protein